MRKKSILRQSCEGRLAEELASLVQERSSGVKALGYTCHAFPAAIAAGLGFRPVRVLCGASSDAESAGEKIVRPDVCPLVKTLLGQVSEGSGLHGEVDIWIGLFTCDQMRRGLDCMAVDLGREVHPVQLPATRTAEAAAYYAAQIRRFVADAETRHGVRFDPGRAKAWQYDRDRAAAVLAQAARSGRVSPLDLHAMFHLFFAARPEGLADFFEGLPASSGSFQSTKTVVLAGSPLSREDTVLLEELEDRGYSVLPLNCTGLNAVEDGAEHRTDDDLIGMLALRSFHQPACTRSRPNTGVYDRIGKTLSSSGAAGLIVKCLKFCDHWYTERERMRRSFDVPVLVFDSDYAEGGRERLLSRIDAFLETMG